MAGGNRSQLSSLTRAALEIYERELRDKLEPEQNGKGIAIHPESGDYLVARSPTEAGLVMRTRHKGGTVTMRIGPPTDADLILAERIRATKSH